MADKFLPRNQFQDLLDALISKGYSLLGPSLQQGAIVYDHFTRVEQLPAGITDSQQPGHYHLHKTQNQRFFSWAAAAQSLKPLCFSPTEVLWQSTVSSDGDLTFSATQSETQSEAQSKTGPIAIIGAKACDLAALDLQDKHFLQQEYIDPYYEKRRNALFLVAVDCSHPADTCFCHSTGDGPAAKKNFDINLIELNDGFLISAGSARGQLIVDTLALQKANAEQLAEKLAQHKAAIAKQTRGLPACDIEDTLKNRQEHTHWDDIGQRCLACGNCTAVCPSCFCHSEHDKSPLGSPTVSHIRQWDSCFSPGHSYIHGIVIRPESKTRYRQWMTHKFSSWVEQYGRSGCTGCGRCISWCPVGIDVTHELAVLCGGNDE